jgi:putative DNA primase/helicase
MEPVTSADSCRQDFERLRREIYERRKRVYDLARDRWPELLRAAGVPDTHRRLKKPGPCPLCKGGRDRYTFDDKYGDGDYVCRNCGSGKGVTFLMKFTGDSWPKTVDWVLERLGDTAIRDALERVTQLRAQTLGSHGSPEEATRRRNRIKEIWTQARRVTTGDPVHLYLTWRVPGLEEIPRVIRFHPALEYFEGAKGESGPRSRGRFPAMLCAVVGADGRCCNMHRTYLSDEGRKATIAGEDGALLDVRKLMPAVGAVSPAIRLAEGQHNHLAVAEGVETALAAQAFTKIPTWSVISTSGMRGFVVPEWASVLTVFADNDRPDANGRRPGFDAAHALARRDDIRERVSNRTLRILVRTPSREGTDVADLLLGIRRKPVG